MPVAKRCNSPAKWPSDHGRVRGSGELDESENEESHVAGSPRTGCFLDAFSYPKPTKKWYGLKR